MPVLQPLDLLRYARRGHQRSKLWLVKVIGQLYADKAVADSVADRAGQPRSTMPEFIFTWHLNRYVWEGHSLGETVVLLVTQIELSGPFLGGRGIPKQALLFYRQWLELVGYGQG